MKIEITAGSPEAEEIAAVTVALLALAEGGAAAPEQADPAWARAARLELQGQRPLSSATDARLR